MMSSKDEVNRLADNNSLYWLRGHKAESDTCFINIEYIPVLNHQHYGGCVACTMRTLNNVDLSDHLLYFISCTKYHLLRTKNSYNDRAGRTGNCDVEKWVVGGGWWVCAGFY